MGVQPIIESVAPFHCEFDNLLRGSGMTRLEMLRALEGELELPEGTLNESQALAEIAEWDSMAALLFIALADREFGAAIAGEQIARSKTFGDLLSLLGDKVTA
jgi:acyl carrier protein